MIIAFFTARNVHTCSSTGFKPRGNTTNLIIGHRMPGTLLQLSKTAIRTGSRRILLMPTSGFGSLCQFLEQAAQVLALFMQIRTSSVQ